MTITTFSYGIYSLSSGTWTSNGVISASDLEFSEQVGSTLMDTFEPGETFSVTNVTPPPPDSAFQDLIYRGFYDSGLPAGRMYLFESSTTPGLFLFASVDFEQPGISPGTVDGSNYPLTIPDAMVDKSTNVMYCFAGGTSIATPRGAKLIETLRQGDLIQTEDGRAVPIKWVGRQTVVLGFNPPARLRPLRIEAGSLGGGLPLKDLVVTPDHALLLDGVLVEARALVGLPGIAQIPAADLGDSYTVYHVETEAHEVILAEGQPAESYIDYVARRAFENYADYPELYGEEPSVPEMDIPRVKTKEHLPPALKARIAAAA